ncbi:MAG: undecaprenyl-diphosphatase UppP [Candidatus Omnitrophota bacterium]
MSLIQSVVLGIVQGVGEFLPISSSAHLILTPWFLGWKPHSLSFDVALHCGTLLAVIAYFWNDWLVILKEGLLSLKEKRISGSPERKIFWFILIASIPAAIAGKFFEETAEKVFRSPLLVAAALGLFAIVLYLSDRFSRKTRTLQSLSVADSVLIGFSQAAAIVPGVSRSGATIACGLVLGLDRESSAKFSFLLSASIIFGAAALKIKDILGLANGGEAASLLVGFAVSAITAFLSIHYLLRYLKKHSFNIFVIYRIILSLIVFSVFLSR